MLVLLFMKLTSGTLELYMSSLLCIKSFLIAAQLIFQLYLRLCSGAVMVSSNKSLFGEEIADSDTR